MAEKMYKTACRGCHGGCLYDVYTDGGRVTRVKPSKDGPLNKGRGCIKGMSVVEQMYHPDRLLYPMKRIGERGSGKFERISWDEAYDTIASRMNALIKKHGPECISSLTGTGRHHLPYLGRFNRAIGTSNAASAGGLICMGPRNTAAKVTTGLFGGVDYFGNIRPGGILVWGTNPAISGPDGELQWFIKDAMKEGIPLLVIDPKPTEPAKAAKIWLRVRPGTDCALALALINIIIGNNWYDREFVENYSVGFEELAGAVKEYTAEKAAVITEIPAEKIYEAAYWISHTKPLALEQGPAIEQTINAMDCCRALLMLIGLTGNYDVPGGHVESMEIAPAGIGDNFPEVDEAVISKSMNLDLPYLKAELQAHPYMMLEAIKTGEPCKIRGLFVHANNTLMTMGDSNHTYECLKEIEFMVYMDIFPNPTAMLADIILPAALWPEVDCVFAMPEFGDQVLLSQRKVVQVGECIPDEEFFIGICRRAGWNYGFTDHRSMMEAQMRIFRERFPEHRDLTLDELREKGFFEPQRVYYKYKKRGFMTPSGKFEFRSSKMEDEGINSMPSYTEGDETPVSRPDLTEKYPLILTTGGRQQAYFASNNRQIRSLRRTEPFPLVRMSPECAGKYGLKEGDWAYIENDRGRITQKVKLEPGMSDTVVNCDYAWWYPEAGAPDYGWRESNANILTRGEGPYDRYIGAYQLRGLLCRVYPNRECKIEERYEKWINSGQ